VPAFRRGRERAGKPVTGGFTCWCITAVHAEREEARRMARRQLAFYFSTPSYRAPSEASGHAAVVEKLQANFRSIGAQWNQLADLIPDDMVDAYTVAGTPTEVQAGLARLEARLAPLGVDELALQLPTNSLDDAAVDALANSVVKHCAPSGR
jgi:alkanesulfonate monooxygenase SsuD/methylene tetrahydromethanopterin reductase-like flavin-dependent oxidoreductase (luciferase family)